MNGLLILDQICIPLTENLHSQNGRLNWYNRIPLFPRFTPEMVGFNFSIRCAHSLYKIMNAHLVQVGNCIKSSLLVRAVFLQVKFYCGAPSKADGGKPTGPRIEELDDLFNKNLPLLEVRGVDGVGAINDKHHISQT